MLFGDTRPYAVRLYKDFSKLAGKTPGCQVPGGLTFKVAGVGFEPSACSRAVESYTGTLAGWRESDIGRQNNLVQGISPLTNAQI